MSAKGDEMAQALAELDRLSEPNPAGPRYTPRPPWVVDVPLLAVDALYVGSAEGPVVLRLVGGSELILQRRTLDGITSAIIRYLAAERMGHVGPMVFDAFGEAFDERPHDAGDGPSAPYPPEGSPYDGTDHSEDGSGP